MSKSASTALAKTPASLPQKSAWANGPPPSTSAVSSPRSQSPAPSHTHTAPTHTRRPSQLSNNNFKDGVGVGVNPNLPRGNATTSKHGNPISFGSVNEKSSSISTPSADLPPVVKSGARQVHSFGSIDASNNSSASKNVPSVSSASSASSTRSTASTAATSPVTTPMKNKIDVNSFFRSTGASSPVVPTFAESVASPPMRTNSLSPAVPSHVPPSMGPSASQGPQPHPHPHPQSSHPYPQPFVPSGLRPQNSVGVGGAPRSPSYQRQVPNGNNVGPRPPVPSGPPGANAGMGSPRLGPPPHHQQHHPPHQQHHQPPPVPGMQPQLQPVPWPYYPNYAYMQNMPSITGVPGPEQYMPYNTAAWHIPHQSGAMSPAPYTHGIPVSPRPAQPPLQTPSTPPSGVANAVPSGRLNTHASAFVPSEPTRQIKIKIESAPGHEVDLNDLARKKGMSTASSGVSTPTGASGTSPSPVPEHKRVAVRLESEEAKQKRIAEEAAKKEEDKRKRRKEEEERKKKEDEARKKEEEERLKKEEEEKKRKEEEEREKERIRKEEEEKERQKLEEERRRKEEEERDRLRKEAEEKERLRKEEEEKQRLLEEKERLRKEEEERIRKEEEEKERLRREEEDRIKAEEAKARAKEEEEKERKSAEIDAKLKEIESASAAADNIPISTSPESHKRRPIPGPLDLSSTHRPGVSQPLPSALATARHIQDISQVQYPEGVRSPSLELNTNAKDGKFRYDREFLLQFMVICKEKPDNLPPLEAIGLEPSDQSQSMGRGGPRRGGSGSMGPPASNATRQASIGLGIMQPPSGFGKSSSGFAMGNFSTPGKLSSEERFMRSTSMSTGPGGLSFPGGRPSPMVRSSSQGGPNGLPSGSMHSKRTRSKRGESRNEANRINPATFGISNSVVANAAAFEPVAPLEVHANRWVATSATRRPQQADQDSPELVDRKVRSLLNKLTMEKFESISNQIIAWANKSENEKDGRTLIQVIRLVFEKATDEADWSEMYARLCRKMMEQISPNVQDDGIRNNEGKPIAGGLLFRKYLLNRCQEDFERGWSAKEATAAAAASKATEDKAIKEANEMQASKEEPGESALYSEEYYVAQKAKRQGLGLVKFIGELFKLQMLTERIMHECIKKLLSNVDNPEEEEIESLCKLLSTVGQALDTTKARGYIDVYLTRMKELAKSNNVSSRIQFMLLDVIELRERKWVPRSQLAAPTTIAQVHEAAAKEKAQQDLARTMNMSRGGSRRGVDRNETPSDGWNVAQGTARPTNKAGDLTHFGKISKGPAVTSFGPNSVFTKKDSKRDSASLSRTSSSSNMFSMLSQGAEAPTEVAVPPVTRPSRPPSRTASVDLSQSAATEVSGLGQRPKLNLLPRSRPIVPEKVEEIPAAPEAVSEDESEKAPVMTKEQVEKKIEQDLKEFFAIRNLDEAEVYFSTLPAEHRHLLVDKLVVSAIESKEADAKLVADFFTRSVDNELVSQSSLEDGFMPTAELLDDIAIDAPKAFDLMAIMLKGAKLDDERRTRIASKSMDNDKLLALLA